MIEFIGEAVVIVILVVGTLKALQWISHKQTTTYIVENEKDKDEHA
jgi:hypothetical protein